MAGRVVRGIGGRRSEYRPLESALSSSSRPGDVAMAIREHFGLSEFYVADLDALRGTGANLASVVNLHEQGFRLWLDAGLREASDAEPLAAAGVETIVAGLETIRGPNVLADLVHRFGSERIVFSLDLRDGRPLGEPAHWPRHDAGSIAAAAVATGIRRLLILDVARVGTGNGPGSERLCAELSAAHPHLELAAGGGVSGVDDVHRLARSGARAVLVASALYDGRLRRADLAGL
jgi:phosphoribosylformimino-5-aminoimidazole carboxamide ribotide isomerase